MIGCKKCQGICGFLLLVLGVLFLLRDLNIWGFWGIQWWTALFILLGVATLGARSCPDCQAIITGKRK
jgi:hypothetical protein